jgi:hypothetical protein
MNRPTQVFIASLCILTVVLGTNISAQSEADGTKPVHWRLIWKTDPAREATVSWNTEAEGETSIVRFRSEDGEHTGEVEAQRNGRFTGSGDKLHYHHARLSDLRPDTRYELTLDTDGETKSGLWFRTAPAEDKDVELLFGGDSRSSQPDRQIMNRYMASLLHERPKLLGLAHGGDYIATGKSLEQWTEWMSDHELTTTEDGRLLPIIPARGNHDGGDLYGEVFDFEDDRMYFATTITEEIRFITLNSETVTGGDQAAWLEDELQKSRPEYRWLVAQYHRPAYPAVKSPGRALRDWVPLFEKYRLDLACEADGHCIKRTVPILFGKPDPEGVPYIGEGGLGVGQRTPKSNLWYLDEGGYASRGNHVQVLSFSGDSLHYQSLSPEGEVLDEHTFEARSKEEIEEALAEPALVP